MIKPKTWWGKIAVAAICFTLDRCSKEWARHSLCVHKSLAFIPGILRFTYTTNTGAAFSLFSEHRDLMTLVASLVTILLIVWICKEEGSAGSLFAILGAGFLLGGALGNLWDRFTIGHVTDFLEFVFISFPIFNVADILIDLGICLILIHTLITKRSPQEDQHAAK